MIIFSYFAVKKKEGCGEEEINLGLLLDVMLGTELRSPRKKKKTRHILN